MFNQKHEKLAKSSKAKPSTQVLSERLFFVNMCHYISLFKLHVFKVSVLYTPEVPKQRTCSLNELTSKKIVQ